MSHQDTSRLCEWAELVEATLPDELACEPDDRSARDGLATER